MDTPQPQPKSDSPTDLLAQVKELIGSFEKVLLKKLDANRIDRRLDISTEQAQIDGTVAKDETFIGIRVIDTNMQREKPTYVAYLSRSNRAAVFIPAQLNAPKPETLELAFTSAVRTNNWQEPFMRHLDATQLHGYGFVEVSADDSSECGTKIQYVENEYMIVSDETKDINAQRMVARKYEVTDAQLDGLAESNDFKTDVVASMRESFSSTQRVSQVYKIARVLYKKDDGSIMTCWYAIDKNQLLTEPVVHVAGVYDAKGQPVPVKFYPFIKMDYRITEQTRLKHADGRAHLDGHAQTALTATWTNFINGCNRASELHPTLDNDLDAGATQLRELEVQISHGKMLNKAIKFLQVPYPDPMMLSAAQALETQNSQQAGQVNFAAQNRKDSRKTATEINAANEQATLISGVDVATYSMFLTSVHSYQWEIIKLNVLAQSPLAPRLLPKITQPELAVCAQTKWRIRPSGDVDFVERQQKIQTLTNLLPLVAGTPAELKVKEKIVELTLPDEQAEIIQLLRGGDIGRALYQTLSVIPAKRALTPEEAAQVASILQTAAQIYGPTEEPATAPVAQ